jgi:hypothetical protein
MCHARLWAIGEDQATTRVLNPSLLTPFDQMEYAFDGVNGVHLISSGDGPFSLPDEASRLKSRRSSHFPCGGQGKKIPKLLRSKSFTDWQGDMPPWSLGPIVSSGRS